MLGWDPQNSPGFINWSECEAAMNSDGVYDCLVHYSSALFGAVDAPAVAKPWVGHVKGERPGSAAMTTAATWRTAGERGWGIQPWLRLPPANSMHRQLRNVPPSSWHTSTNGQAGTTKVTRRPGSSHSGGHRIHEAVATG